MTLSMSDQSAKPWRDALSIGFDTVDSQGWEAVNRTVQYYIRDAGVGSMEDIQAVVLNSYVTYNHYNIYIWGRESATGDVLKGETKLVARPWNDQTAFKEKFLSDPAILCRVAGIIFGLAENPVVIIIVNGPPDKLAKLLA